jgi:hypothetical protein
VYQLKDKNDSSTCDSIARNKSLPRSTPFADGAAFNSALQGAGEENPSFGKQETKKKRKSLFKLLNILSKRRETNEVE